jgi:hypothetical protein
MPQLEGLKLLELRQNVLKILMSNFPNTPNRYIYECANEWCGKQVVTNGIVSYFKAYYGKNERQEGSKKIT